MDFSRTILRTGLFPIAGCLDRFQSLLYFEEIPVVCAISVDPDQMPHYVVSDLGLHCLPFTFLESPDKSWLEDM